MMVAGIDPGLSGAVFLLDSALGTGCAYDMPVHLLVRGGKNKHEVDVQALIAILSAQPIHHAIIENVSALPPMANRGTDKKKPGGGQGVASAFAFGKCYGIIIGTVAALHIPVTFVSPNFWKRTLGVPAMKDGARARASQLMPALAPQWPLKKHDSRAESALIALYGARALHGHPQEPHPEVAGSDGQSAPASASTLELFMGALR